ncbi:MAG TPA: hypothetical protein VMW08_19395 [Acidimicrobiales bacterium]|nr:hypothetical protein [Acidimicrobiales bacterium]
MSEAFDPDAMVERFRERAAAVKKRNLPAVGGDERARFIEQAQTDFQDYAMIGDATAELVDGVLTLTVDLRPDADA